MRSALPRKSWLPGRHVRVFPVEEVESRSLEAGAPARAAGLTDDAVAAIWSAACGLYRTGLHPAIAICLRRGGRVVLDRALGHLWGNGPDDPPEAPRRRARHDSLF